MGTYLSTLIEGTPFSNPFIVPTSVYKSSVANSLLTDKRHIDMGCKVSRGTSYELLRSSIG